MTCRHFSPGLILMAALAGCGDFPQLEDPMGSSARNASYPDLLPIEDISAQVPAARIEPETTSEVEARVARLKARAARLNGTVIDGATNSRLKEGIN